MYIVCMQCIQNVHSVGQKVTQRGTGGTQGTIFDRQSKMYAASVQLLLAVYGVHPVKMTAGCVQHVHFLLPMYIRNIPVHRMYKVCMHCIQNVHSLGQKVTKRGTGRPIGDDLRQAEQSIYSICTAIPGCRRFASCVQEGRLCTACAQLTTNVH